MPTDSPIQVRPVEPSEIDALLAHFPGASVFHSRAWLTTISKSHNVRIFAARADRNGSPIAFWPYLEMRKGPFRVIGSPLPGWSTAYIGPITNSADPNDAQAILNAFLGHRLFKWYAYAAVKTVGNPCPFDFAAAGFTKVTDLETYLIDLTQSEDAIWNNMKGECRSRIRKAEKLGIEIREEAAPDFLEDFWAMSLETFSKSGIQPTHTREFCVGVWNNLRPVNRLHVISAFYEGKRIATLVLPFDAHTMYYWGGASFSEFRELPAHNALHWRAMKDAKSLGLKSSDMVSTSGGPGRFKKTFGPQAFVVGAHWERSPNKLLSAVKRRYEAYLRRKHAASAVASDS
ncbi:MAG TPA: GNAT family N-acetyltransferase [Phycisphaerales bacterium]|nr:GNAT family N-acetyltransferase [Phycisphaerales bacterium]